MNNQFIEINYEKIKKQYDLALVDQLRDFGSNHLKLWVPDSENIIISILNLIYSLHQSNYLKINMYVSLIELYQKNYYYKVIYGSIKKRRIRNS